MEDRLIEKLEVLDGSRARQDLKQAAARISDMEAVLQLPNMKSNAVSAAPTASDFNALREDVKAISEALLTISLALRKRIVR